MCTYMYKLRWIWPSLFHHYHRAYVFHSLFYKVLVHFPSNPTRDNSIYVCPHTPDKWAIEAVGKFQTCTDDDVHCTPIVYFILWCCRFLMFFPSFSRWRFLIPHDPHATTMFASVLLHFRFSSLTHINITASGKFQVSLRFLYKRSWDFNNLSRV